MRLLLLLLLFHHIPTFQSGQVGDGSAALIKVCMLIEEVFCHGTKSKTSFLGEDLGFWGYFCDCLDEDSEIIRAVSSIPQHKTTVGKGALSKTRTTVRCWQSAGQH